MKVVARFIVSVFLFVLVTSGVDASRGDTAFFDGGYVHVNSSTITGRLRAEVQFRRLGTRSDGILFVFFSAAVSPDYFAVVLRSGRLMSVVRFGDDVDVTSHDKLSIPALHWHRLVIGLQWTSVTLNLPDVSVTSTRNITGFSRQSSPSVFNQLYLGGIPEEKHGFFPDLPTYSAFWGCLRSLQIMSTDINFHGFDENRLDSFRVKSGNCCVEVTPHCPLEQVRPVIIPSSCPLSQFNFSWSEIAVIAQQIQVSEGGKTVLDTNIFTMDTPQDVADVWLQLEPLVYKAVVFQLVTPPRHGSVKKNGGSAESGMAELVEHFKYKALALSSIFYFHDGSETTWDSFALQLNITCEGFVVLSKSLVFPIVIRPQNDPPQVSQLSSLRLAVGTRHILGPSILSVTDPDSDMSRISFEVMNTLKSGRFEKVDRAGVVIRRFYQEDVFNGTVAFQHFYSSGLSLFGILLLINDGSGSTSERVRVMVEPYQGAINVVNSTCLKVIEESSGTLQSRNLGILTSFEDQKPDVWFTLQSVTSHGVIQLLVPSPDNALWQTLNKGDSFLRQDIQLNRVRYLQNSSSSVEFSQLKDWFNVTIMSYEAPGPSVHQCIEVIPQISLEQSRFELVTRVLNLSEGGLAVVGPHNIEVLLLPASLMEWLNERGGLDSIGLHFSITVPPQHGNITLNEAPLNKTFFILSDLLSGVLVYRHDGSEEHRDELAFSVEATDVKPTELKSHPPGEINGVLPIFIAPVNNHRPVVEAWDITPLEGGSQIVDQSILSITDLDEPGDVIWITYERNQFDNGYFAFVSNISEVVTRFTAEDIHAGRLIFHHRFGDVLTRLYVFNITDGENWLQKEIKVRAKPPVLNVSIADGEGSTCPFMFDADEQVGYRLHPEFFIVSTNAPGRRPDIKITVVLAPQYGDLHLESKRLRANSEFEMRHIDSGDFLYMLRNRTVQTNQDRFSLQFELGSTTTVLDVPMCIDPVPVPELKNVYSDNDSLRLRVPVNGIQVITKDLLQATDSRGGLFLGGLEYNIAIPPQYGRIVNRSKGEEGVHRFTQLDINSQHIAYIHDQPDSKQMDYFTFKLRNKYFTLAPVGVTVDLYHTNISITNSGFTVTEGKHHTITTSEFFVSAPPGYSTYITIVTPPLHGDMLYGTQRLPLRQRVMTPSDLSSGLLSYAHDSSETVFDSFVFEVTANVTDPVMRNMYNGVVEHLGDFLGVVNITVNLINDNPPDPHNTSDLIVWEGSSANINTSILAYRDKDINYNVSNLNYTVNVFFNQGGHCGYLYFVERPLVPVTTFLQADLEAGRLWYKHDRTKQCSPPGLEYFLYSVSDGGLQSPNILNVIIVSFIISPVNKGLTLDEGAQAIISSMALSASVNGNAEIASSEFVFIISQLPRNGRLEVAGVPFNNSFSREDIERDKLTYIHDGSDTIEDSFQFDVTVRNFTITNQTFVITIEPVDDTPPSVEVLEELRVVETERGYLSRRHLRAMDSEQRDRELTFVVLTGPQYGTLYRRLSPDHRSIKENSFTQEDINKEVIFYENSISLVVPNWWDSFTLSLSDGPNLLQEMITVRVLLMPKQLPIRRRVLVVPENRLRVIGTENLMVNHPVYADRQTNYTVIRQPDYGELYSLDPARYEDTITTFTQTSVDSRFIVYAHDGSESTSDVIGLKAISTEDNLSSGAFELRVSITAVNDEEPVLSNPNSVLQIWNGDTVHLNEAVILATDEDNSPEELLYTFNLTADSRSQGVGHFAWSHNHSVPIETFSQWNITRKEVVFVHNGLRNATLSFNVSDGVHITLGSLTILAKPIYITLSINVPVLVEMEGSHNLLHSLKATTNDGRVHVTTYTVTAVCQYGRLLRDGSEVLSVGSSFTQDDINSRRIAYHHTDMNRWEREDRFQFQVSVPYAVQPHSDTFTIKIRLRQDISINQTVTNPLSVTEGGHACFSEAHLDARNLRYKAWKIHNLTVPIESLQIFYKVTAGLRYGKLGLRGRIESDTPTSGSVNVFWQDETDQSFSCYFHDGSDSVKDGFTFEVNIVREPGMIGAGSLFKSDGKFEIEIKPVNDERPVIDEASSLEVLVVDGFLGGLTRNHLRIVDPDTPPKDLRIEFSERPRSLQLLHRGEMNGVWRFTQADINNNTVKFLHDGASPDRVQLSFQFTDGNQSHIGNGTITIVIVPRQLNFTGTGHLVYQQDAEKVLISMSVLNVWTNVLRSEITITVSSAPTSGVIRTNLSSDEVGNFLQTDIDNGLLFYHPTNMSTSQDSFVITLESGKQRIDQTVKVSVVSRLQLQSATLSSPSNTLTYLLPADLFQVPDASPALNPHITVTTSPRYGTLSKRARVIKRQLTEVFDFLYSELQEQQVQYTIDRTLQNGTDYIAVEEFEALVRMTPTGQLGTLKVTFAVEVQRVVPQTVTPTTQDPLSTGDAGGSADNTLVAVPVLGIVVVMLVVVGIVVGALLVRCHRLRERDRRRRERKKKAQKSNQKSEAGQPLPSVDCATPEGEDTSSGSTIGGDVTATDKQFSPMQIVDADGGPFQGTTSLVPPVFTQIELNGVDSAGLPPYSQQPIPVPLPKKPPLDVTSVYSQGGSPRRSPAARAAAKKRFGLTYNTSAVDSDVKKLFRSDYPQLKHVEYWV